MAGKPAQEATDSNGLSAKGAAADQPAAHEPAEQPQGCDTSGSRPDCDGAPLPEPAGALGAAAAAEPATAEPHAAAAEKAAPSSSSLPADPEGLNLQLALQLYGLTCFRELFGAEHDAKCVLGWGSESGDGTVVICFRGTTSLVNITNNLKVGRGG